MKIASKVVVITAIIIIGGVSIFLLLRSQSRSRAARSIAATIERCLSSKDRDESMLVDIDPGFAEYIALIPPYTGQNVRFIGGEPDAAIAAIVSKSSIQSNNRRARIAVLRQGHIIAESDIAVPRGPDAVVWKVNNGKILLTN